MTRGHLFEFSLQQRPDSGEYEALVQITPIDDDGQAIGAPTHTSSQPISPPRPGRVMNVEFWHVDQSLTIYLNGERVVGPLEYDWDPKLRMENAYQLAYDEVLDKLPRIGPRPATLHWRFQGSPVTLHRVRVDRDLYYQPSRIRGFAHKNPELDKYADLLRTGSPAFGTHPDKPAVLGPDQFLMLGDNSPFSSDSRLWGSPHALVATQIDDAPFLVNRKLLLGKAWVVYFPAPYSLKDGGRGVIPDFGRLRFIR